MTPAQNRLRRKLRGTVSPVLDCFGNRIGRIMMRLDKDFQVDRIKYSEIQVENVELQKGDYTLPMTEDQWNELLDIEDWKSLRLTYNKNRGILFDGYHLLHTFEEYNPKTLLTFEQFKQRAINTFKK